MYLHLHHRNQTKALQEWQILTGNEQWKHLKQKKIMKTAEAVLRKSDKFDKLIKKTFREECVLHIRCVLVMETIFNRGAIVNRPVFFLFFRFLTNHE